jgi:protein SCO1/2
MNPKPIRFLLATAMLPVILLGSCDHPEPHPKDSGQRALDFPTNVTAYQVKGVLQEIRAAGRKALIQHEEIPGYMEAMTMQLDVYNPNELAGLQPGDQMTFRLLVTDTEAWIDHVQKTGLNIAPAPAPGVAEFPELNPGDPLPDCGLTNQLGQPIHLSDFKGRALAFTFIFTRCPLPTFCPRMNSHLAAVQQALLAANAGTNWHLLSISFDPEFDTPERLAQYAKSYGQEPAHWSFATGATADIRQLGNNFSLVFAPEGAVFNHNVRTVVVDPAGRIQEVFAGNEWQPAELVAALQKAMEPKP